MKVLVTGATGFIGQKLCERMLADGLQVLGTSRSDKLVNKLPVGIDIVQIKSIDAKTDWTQALVGVDVVIHLAARVHIMREIASDPFKEFFITNVEGTAQLAQQAALAKVKRFIFMSTIGVNGNSSGNTSYTEEDSACPHNTYSLSKREAEDRLTTIALDTEMEVVIIRAPLVYGGGDPGNFLALLRAVAKGIPLPLASIRNQKSFLYVENLVDALVVCATHSAAKGVYLVSDSEDLSTPELIRRLAMILGQPARLFPFPLFIMRMVGKLFGKLDILDRLVNSLTINSSKIRKELNWKPPYSMEQGLQRTVEWLRGRP